MQKLLLFKLLLFNRYVLEDLFGLQLPPPLSSLIATASLLDVCGGIDAEEFASLIVTKLKLVVTLFVSDAKLM